MSSEAETCERQDKTLLWGWWAKPLCGGYVYAVPWSWESAFEKRIQERAGTDWMCACGTKIKKR